MTDGRMKYIWRPANGSEQLFDLHNDPHEKRNLKSHPDYSANLIRLRSRLATHLQNRPEGFSNGTQLISGCQYEAVIRAER